MTRFVTPQHNVPRTSRGMAGFVRAAGMAVAHAANPKCRIHHANIGGNNWWFDCAGIS